jgi:hypothetical protein
LVGLLGCDGLVGLLGCDGMGLNYFFHIGGQL